MEGSELRKLRLAAGLTAREVGAEVGRSPRAVEQAELRHLQPKTFVRYLSAIRTVLERRLREIEAAERTLRLVA